MFCKILYILLSNKLRKVIVRYCHSYLQRLIVHFVKHFQELQLFRLKMTDQELEVFVLNDEFDAGAGLNPDNFDEVVKNIRVLITKLKGSHMSEGNIREFELNFSTPQLSDGSRVDYQQMSKSDVFLEYCREVSKLKSLNAAALEQNKVFCKHNILYHLCIFFQRKSLFINIYNSLTIHAMVHQARISQGQLPDSPIKVVLN